MMSIIHHILTFYLNHVLCLSIPQEDGKNIRVYLNLEIQKGYSVITSGYAYVAKIVSG